MYLRNNFTIFLLAVTLLMFCWMGTALCDDDDEGLGEASGGVMQGWQSDFNLDNRIFADQGENSYFILKPGFQIVLADEDDRVTLTVMDETREVGNIMTRVVEEREEEDGELVEISRNFFAIDADNGDVFYFGEEVDIYKKGKVVKHEGAWLAYEGDALPGLIMPGSPKIGMKYYQEIAPGKALDRGEVISLTETFKTPAGTFDNCLKTKETSGLNPLEKEYKRYAPGIGQIQDEDLLLVKYGYIVEE
ncbi:hypothetical protein KKA00_00715 [bacterium]|nr:hypothetical protein [bacterium]MBU1650712.1 hypothetical protein [bacterium]